MERATEKLRDYCQDDWNAVVQHEFCKQLAAGTLPAQRMRDYLVQDYKFVDTFVRLIASAIATAPGLADSVPAAQFLALITGKENTYFLRSFEALGVSDQGGSIAAGPATAGFNDLMKEAIASGKYERMLAVICVAEWSYLSWATPFNPPDQDLPFWLSEWITLHAGPDFEAVVEYFRTQLDRYWDSLNETARSEVKSIFCRAVALERQFFDEAMAG